jgi:hypothetical protein
MNANILSLAVGTALISSIIASIVTYQGIPNGKKWKCLIPIGSYFVLGGAVALVLGVLAGLRIVDAQTSRYIFLIFCVLITAFSVSVYFKYK